VLGLALLIGSASLTFSDFFPVPSETPSGLRRGQSYLLDDRFAVDDVRDRMDKVGMKAAATVFRPALERDPASAYRWCDVGESLLAAGDGKNAALCYRRAGELAPADPRILLNLGDYYTLIGDNQTAVRQFAGILSHSGVPLGDSLVYNVFSYYERLRVRQRGWLDRAIPNRESAAGYVRYLMEGSDASAVLQVWRWAQTKFNAHERLALDYTGYLWRKGQLDEAAQDWKAYFHDRHRSPADSLLFNGGFEYEPNGGILDWQIASSNSVHAALDRAMPFEGTASLRIDFTGNDNRDFHDIGENVVLSPGRYHFEAMARTRNITSDEGVRFRIFTVQGRSPVNAETPALTGTTDWSRLEATFDVPADVKAIEVAVARRRSIRIDNQFSGTAWIDAVKLTRIQ
jgi:tetratricopeptide (TPR) repeat protein